MSERWTIGVIFLAPVALLAALYAFGLSIPVPAFGRNYVLRIDLPDGNAKIGLPEIKGPQDVTRPLVVIDPGHGGHDPGAVTSGIREKNLTLSYAKELEARLLLEGGIRVALTRGGDNFLVLQERAQIARDLGADLFISIHADAAEVSGASGATIYTRSEEATDADAAALAARENRADQINGVELADQSDAVTDILIDLSQRRKQEGSREFARLIVREANGDLKLHPSPLRSAAFAVLKAPDMPSILFEIGFITNPKEAQRLSSAGARERFARTVDRAVRVYFARQADL